MQIARTDFALLDPTIAEYSYGGPTSSASTTNVSRLIAIIAVVSSGGAR